MDPRIQTEAGGNRLAPALSRNEISIYLFTEKRMNAELAEFKRKFLYLLCMEFESWSDSSSLGPRHHSVQGTIFLSYINAPTKNGAQYFRTK